MSHLLVTGGARGIGRATCRLAAARGSAVSFCWRSDAAAAASLADATGACAVRADVASEADTAALFDAAEAAFGPVTAVVANAGIVTPTGPLADLDAADLHRVVATNVTGALLTAREAARRLGRSRGGPGGGLVLVSSVASRLGAPGEYVAYAATKGAVDTLALGLARELGADGVRVNAVRPGTVETGIHADPGRPARVGAATPLGRPATAEEVAEAILWLLSDAASYVSGAILDVTGGR